MKAQRIYDEIDAVHSALKALNLTEAVNEFLFAKLNRAKDELQKEIKNESDRKETIEAYKECFEKFIPIDSWDEATKFLSTYNNGLAIDFEKRERLNNAIRKKNKR